MGSVAAVRAPIPPASAETPVTMRSKSPRRPLNKASISSIPITATETGSPPKTDRKAKRRRESGLIVAPILRSPTPPTETYVEISEEEGEIAPLPETSTVTRLAPTSAKTKERAPLVKMKDIAAGLAHDRLGSAASVVANTVGAEEGIDGPISPKRMGDKALAQLAEAAEERSARGDSSSLSSRMSTISSETEAAIAADEEGGRGRRARRSVNYKEPSLHK